MSYHVGVDLGTTYTSVAAATERGVEMVPLDEASAVIPSVIYIPESGDIVAGAAAARRSATDPMRVVREFKRRVGDSVPIMVGATSYSVDVFMSRLLRHVLDVAIERRGVQPDGIAVTHPANWGPFKLGVLTQAIDAANVGPFVNLSEPEAAAVHYASTERVAPGEKVAVYDLGGGTFDAAILEKSDDVESFRLLGDVEGIERLGGIDFDEAVFQHVLRWVGSAFTDLDPDDPLVIQSVARLRQECTTAKEALSVDTEVSIPVLLPSINTEVRLTRLEFDGMIRPSISQSIASLRRAIRGAGIDPSDLRAILLVGGSSRIPLVGEMVAAETGVGIALDVHPKHAVALGAARAAAARLAGLDVPGAANRGADVDSAPEPADAGRVDQASGADLVSPTAAPNALDAVATASADELPATTPELPSSQHVASTGAGDVPPPTPVDPAGLAAAATPPAPPIQAPEPSRRSPWPLILGIVGALLLVAVLGVAALRGGGESSDTTTAARESTTTQASESETTPATVEEPVISIEPGPGLEFQVAGGLGTVEVHTGPSAKTTEAGTVDSGEVVTVVSGELITGTGNQWLQIEAPVAGWIRADLLEDVG